MLCGSMKCPTFQTSSLYVRNGQEAGGYSRSRRAGVLARQGKVSVERFEFSGPIPHPAMLEKYERILSGSADRILSMAEREQGHRHVAETEGQKSRTKGRLVGQILAFLIAVVTFIVVLIIALQRLTPWALSVVVIPLSQALAIYKRDGSKHLPPTDQNKEQH